MNWQKLWWLVVVILVSFPGRGSRAQTQSVEMVPSALKALGAPNNPKIEVAWNRYYDWAGVTALVHRFAETFPHLCRLEQIGTSYGGRPLWALTITNFQKGKPEDKPAMYIDASIHANEIQAVEVALYTAWFLLESYGNNPFITELLDTRTFYIVPGQSPDSRDRFMHSANNPHSPRSGQVPRDDDGDGLINEDPPDDLNGDGYITQMRVRAPGGRWKVDPEDPRRMVRARPDEEGEYYLFWTEGYDNDGDGQINEDGDGYYDPNRNWGWMWRPHYVQYGADWFPFSLPETKAVSDFIKSHPNILGGQSYHNAGGMILRGPGAKEDRIESEDLKLFDLMGKFGEQLLPGYRYLVTHRDLYTVYGGETDWMYGAEGILPFVNELWTPYNMFRKQYPKDNWFGAGKDQYKFDRYLLLGEAFVDWQPVAHPQYGMVEVGGFKKTYTRMPPSFLLEEECHRNMIFTLWHAYHLPLITLDSVQVIPLGQQRYRVTLIIHNHRAFPTRLQVDVKNGITRPDIVTLQGLPVLAGGVHRTVFSPTFEAQQAHPERLKIERIPGFGAVRVSWIVRGTGLIQITFDSVKGGKYQKRVVVR